MGYYTQFSLLEPSSDDPHYRAIVAWAEQYDRSNNADLALSLFGDAPAKWYEWQTDMAALSRAFPDMLFTVEGVGDEPYDIWRAYFQNGLMQEAPGEIIFPPFDPARLIPVDEPHSPTKG